MDVIKKNWFSESCEMWPGSTFSFEVKKLLHKERSPFQEIQVFDSTSLGRVLVLDGIIQCTQKDEYSYQEMISFLPLCCHRNPEKVLIVGGGDGGVARDVAKHPNVKEIVQVEIDAKVIEVSKKYLPFMAVGFDSKKLTLHVGDGFEFMKNHSHEFDVIITDSSDPIGPAVSLFQENYFSLMKSALKPNGIVCSQAGTYWDNMDLVKNTLNICKNQFPSAAYAITSVPTYPSGSIGFVIGSLEENVKFDNPVREFTREQLNDMDLKYYNTDIHKAAFALPNFVKNVIDA
ncbi:spermidine synthase [Danaus plexippus]|uniref:Spermidine synthase like protein n=1 Tax=Danaus plexippus plexippus TaxID=278856 RepID=A0A212EK56_DANPL|nr:spermidine synthase isoform X1 [Danaus plexippus plexippus]XP_032515041.1 spermidine synthase isoform X2 [Danaus plexippus plexippus]XP_061381611.1 spermidine synthase [Danaus plexippus]OWR41828.1 spermidine synthase like protein [Danaus plexippus plexippus]